MALNKVYSQYKENTIYTSTPEELTMMLYNGLVKFIMQGQQAIDEKNIQKANESIIRAEDILLHFESTLDMKYEVSQGLLLLYDYMYRRLVEANVEKDKEILEEVLGFAKELRETWAQAMKLAKQKQTERKTI
ncbi:MAG: flagellar export chaperone FliS [Clostridia bacterium]|nr:flagellar export chaperone FliS [Clostridia bacterium]